MKEGQIQFSALRGSQCRERGIPCIKYNTMWIKSHHHEKLSSGGMGSPNAYGNFLNSLFFEMTSALWNISYFSSLRLFRSPVPKHFSQTFVIHIRFPKILVHHYLFKLFGKKKMKIFLHVFDSTKYNNYRQMICRWMDGWLTDKETDGFLNHSKCMLVSQGMESLEQPDGLWKEV